MDGFPSQMIDSRSGCVGASLGRGYPAAV